MSENFIFEVQGRDPASRARVGRLTTPHGAIETPAFVFCATRAAIKAVMPAQARAAGTQVVLANTYHLMLRPGADLIARLGGLHRFMGWDGPMLTDSGGFQIFSLGHGTVAEEIKGNRELSQVPTLIEITEEGARFRSYLDGSEHTLTPEISIDVQRKLGADLVLVLDECTSYHVERDYTARSLELTHRWAARSLAEFERGEGRGVSGPQALYGIVQGGVYEDLRRESAEFLSAMPLFGHAIGGSLGAEKSEMYEVVEMAMANLARARPVHLLGIGEAEDLWTAVALGIDTFDCVQPTRLARHGHALIRPGSDDEAAGGQLRLRNARFRDDPRPPEEGCACTTCHSFSRAYLHYLLKSGEVLALQLLSVHNIHFMNALMAAIRAAIREGRFREAWRAWAGDGRARSLHAHTIT